MVSNPFKAVYNRFLGKRTGTWDMDDLQVGREDYDNPLGYLETQYGYRTGFFGGHVNMGKVPNAFIKSTSSPQCSSLKIILPHKPGSRGYYLFQELPLAKLALVQHEIDLLKAQLSAQIEAGLSIRSPEQFKQIVLGIRDIVIQFEKKVAPITESVPIPIQSTVMEK